MMLRVSSWLLEAQHQFGWATPVWTLCSSSWGSWFSQLLVCAKVGDYIEK